MARKQAEPCEMNMTPMIDVVFQLMIFFIVTIKMAREMNPDIKLEHGPHGQLIKSENAQDTTLSIEVSKSGRISIYNVALSESELKALLRRRYNQYGQYPVLIRADYRTPHRDVRKVMDACTESGMWKINFAAIKEKKTKD